MSWIEASGYLASSLVLVTFCMQTMLMLRTVAICSNFAFIFYGLGDALYPVLVLHIILLPLNVIQLVRTIRTVRKAKVAANTDLSPNWLRPFMRSRHIRAGETIFARGEYADALYLIVSGQVELPDLKLTLRDGEIFGEIGLFCIHRRRTQTARAISDLELLWISADQLKTLCEQNPGLSLYFLRLVATRLVLNAPEPANKVGASHGGLPVALSHGCPSPAPLTLWGLRRVRATGLGISRCSAGCCGTNPGR